MKFSSFDESDEPGRDIPEGIKREVRQRCGFGCVICGLPIYQYDHKLGWAVVRRHRADEITLLCPNHHEQKKKKLLPDERVEEADRYPYNRGQPATSPNAMWFGGREPPEIVMGNAVFTCDEDPRRPTVLVPLLVYGHTAFAFMIDTDGLLLNIDARDSKGRRILFVRDSELLLSTGVWDATFVGPNLRIWERSGLLSISLTFHPPRRIIVNQYHVHVLGGTIDVEQYTIKFLGGGLAKAIFETPEGTHLTVSANVGMLLGDMPPGLSGPVIMVRRSCEIDGADVKESKLSGSGKRVPKSPRTCLFCDGEPISEVQIYPEWMRDYLRPGGNSTFHTSMFDQTTGTHESANRLFEGDHRSRKLKAVCARCINGWMSEVQNEAKSILLPLVLGERRALDATEQRSLATWATMFTMVYEAANPPTQITHPIERLLFRAHPSPLPNWTVWAAPYGDVSCPSYHRCLIAENVKMTPPDGRPPIFTTVKLQITQFAPGRACLVTVSAAPEPFFEVCADKIVRPLLHRFGFIEIWPHRRTPLYISDGRAAPLVQRDLLQLRDIMFDEILTLANAPNAKRPTSPT